MIRLLLIPLLATSLFAQTPIPAKGSISGVVRDANTGAPVPDASVSASIPPARPVQATSDSQGRFSLRNVDPGTVQLSASGPRLDGAPFPTVTRKIITLLPGQTLETIDVPIRTVGQITGLITDQNDQPIPDTLVALVAREYQSGEIRYVYAAIARTDDQGRYIANAAPGRTYMVMAMRPAGEVASLADAPTNPKLRRPSVVPTYYPGVEGPDGAQTFKLGSGERRENIDIRLHRAESFCAEGTLQTGGAPASLRFTYAEAYPHSGTSGEGGLYLSGFNGRTGDDGKIRVCDLHPGQYRFVVSASGPNPLSGTTAFGIGMATITDRDAAIVFSATPFTEIPAEVAWNESPKEGLTWPTNWFFRPVPITRTVYPPETTGLSLPKPGEPFSLKVFTDDFNVRFQGNPPEGVYVKSVLYGNTDVRLKPLHPGSATGDAKLRILIAHDGGTFRARVADKDGKAIADQYVLAFPVTSITEAQVAESVITGQTDQNGSWTSPMIAPGKYYVIASRVPFDRTPEFVTALLRARQKASEADLSPSGRLDVNLQPISIE